MSEPLPLIPWLPEEYAALKNRTPWVAVHGYRHGAEERPTPPLPSDGGRWRGRRGLVVGLDASCLPAEALWHRYDLHLGRIAKGALDLAEARPRPVSYDVLVMGAGFAQVAGPWALFALGSAVRAGGLALWPTGAPLLLPPGWERCPAPDPGWEAAVRTRMRVLVVAPWLVTGGADWGLIQLLAALPTEQFELLLATTEPAENPWLPRALPYVAEHWDLGSLTEDPERRRELLAALAVRRAVDLMFVMHAQVGYDVIPTLKSQTGARVVVQLHLEEPTEGQGWPFYVTSRYGNLVDRFWVVSEHLQNRLQHAYYVDANRIRLIPLGVKIPASPPPWPPSAPLTVLYAGRLVAQKRPDRLLAIASRIAAEGLPVVIHVVGDGPEQIRLEREVRRRRLQNVVRMHGPATPASMEAWYARVHLVLLTSDYEGLPLVVLEAMAHGRPALAPAVGAVAEAVSDDRGILVTRPDDIDAYVAALRQGVQHPEGLQASGSRARIWVATRHALPAVQTRMRDALAAEIVIPAVHHDQARPAESAF